jgi:dTDP-4-dehydrorhamnose 3,5-epimerase
LTTAGVERIEYRTLDPFPEVLAVKPRVFGDARGFFSESYNAREFDAVIGRRVRFVQDNHSRSAGGVLRGLHYQLSRPQGKLIRVIAGLIFDVAVDVRRASPTFGRWAGCELGAREHTQIWIPEGFAHGFLVLSESADVLYKTTDYYAPEAECCIRWDDPDIGIEWPLEQPPLLSKRDRQGTDLAHAEVFG